MNKNLLESLSQPIICIEDGILWMNSSAEVFTGYNNKEINCKNSWNNILQLTPGEELITTSQGTAKLKAGIIQKDNSIKKIEFTLQNLNNLETWTLYSSIENTFLENNLKDKDKILSVIYDSTSDLMFLVSADDDGGFTYLSVNNTFINVTGLSKDKCIGKQTGEIFGQDISSSFNQAFQEVVTRKEKVKIEFNYAFENKSFFFDASLRPILDLKNQCVYILVVARDLTERKKREDELLKTKILAEESNRLKTTLLSNLSHEFRTPLNGILGFADLLKEELTLPEHREMANNIVRSGKRLFSTLNSILELSRLEAERKETYNTTIRLYDVVSDIVKKYQQEAANKGLFFSVKIKSPSLKLHLDESILIQIMHNLLDNAIKFTKTGGVKILVEEIFEEYKTYALIKIIDTGIGISEENLESIFKEFKQESEGISRSHEGTGLGLTLAKKMTELMGGEILVESQKHKGSIFSLKFPAMGNRVERIKLDSVHKIPIKQAKKSGKMPLVLLVEDNELNNKLTMVYLKDTCIVDSVQNASDALRMINEKTYNAILMDVNLGEGMNGVDIVQSARTMDKYCDTPIIAITGYALNNDKDKLLKCGFSHYLAKPYGKGQLLELINEALLLETV
ncbi:MAG: ATP-binding protein [Ignavibacteriaceae bacterium]|nr:ATP-binding protein [Ignavibacteriaceae bacterium]